MTDDFSSFVGVSFDEAEWVKLGSLAKIKIRAGIYVPVADRGDGYPMIDTGEMFSGDILYDDSSTQCVPVLDKDKQKFLLRYGDIVFARKSLADDAGKASIFVGSNETVAFSEGVIRVELDTSKVDPFYAFAFFNSEFGSNLVSTISEKTAAAGIRASDLAILPFPVLSEEKQKEISDLFRIRLDCERKLKDINETIEAVRQVSETAISKHISG